MMMLCWSANGHFFLLYTKNDSNVTQIYLKMFHADLNFLCFSGTNQKAEGRRPFWNWSGKTLSPGALLAVLYFSLRHIFPHV